MTIRKKIFVSVSVTLSLAGLAVATLYLWPLQSPALKTAHIQAVGYDQGVAQIQRRIQDEERNPTLKPECRSQLFNHGRKTARAVIMFPGYRNCPVNFGQLAKHFYNQGYNVYVPLVPEFGTRDEQGHARITAAGLKEHANQAINLSSGLGEEVGTVGLSGGGVLATWSGLFRDDTIKRLLVLSPFYEPHPSQLPKWLVKPFVVLYGFNLLPDRFNEAGQSYHALAQYVMLSANLQRESRPNLVSAALVLATGDNQVDHEVARAVINRLSDRPVVYVPPAELGVAHDIVNPTGKDINGRALELYPQYLRLYERR